MRLFTSEMNDDGQYMTIDYDTRYVVKAYEDPGHFYNNEPSCIRCFDTEEEAFNTVLFNNKILTCEEEEELYGDFCCPDKDLFM